MLVVSQFTLYGDTTGGRRPSWIAAARPEHAEPLVDAVVAALRALGATVATGRFRTEMQVELVNDGPVTLCSSADGSTRGDRSTRGAQPSVGAADQRRTSSSDERRSRPVAERRRTTCVAGRAARRRGGCTACSLTRGALDARRRRA